MMTIFRVSESSSDFDNMQTYEARKERAVLVRDKLRKVFPYANIHADNHPSEGDPEIIRMIENEMKAILNLLPE